MPEIIVYTDSGDCANGVAEVQPFTTGDATDEWTVRFNNGTDFYAVSGATMRVGHVNGLPDGSYGNAFKWTDRAGTSSTATIAVTSGVPSLSFDANPAGGLVGTDGIYILRGPDLDGSISNVVVRDGGAGYSIQRFTGYTDYKTVSFFAVGSGTGFSATALINTVGQYNFGPVSGAVTLISGGKGYSRGDIITDANNFRSGTGFDDATVTVRATLSFDVNAAKYEFPFMESESGTNIIAATTLSPYSDGAVTNTTEYDNSTLIIRPELVASATLAESGSGSTAKWTGTMNPINAYVTSRLALRNSTQLDLQIRGDGRTLFQGQLTILNKMT